MLRYREIKMMLFDMIQRMNNGDKLPSRTTLSRKLDSSRATIDKAIRELTEEGILESRYGSGTYVARKLAGVVVNAENWCLIVPDISESIYAQMASGVESEARERNANVIICNSESDAKKQAEYIERLIYAGIAGFIIVPVVTRNVLENIELYRSLCRARIPFVFCNRDVEGVFAPVVKSNDYYGGYVATLHLIRQGYRHIAFLARTRYRTSIDRCQGYISALQQSSVEINRQLILLQTDGSYAEACNALIQRLQEGVEMDAVFCFNDYIAVKLIQALNEHGYRVPEDIAIIGYDNISSCAATTPTLTSMSYKSNDVGKMAAHVLGKILDGKSRDAFEYYLIQPELVVRSSCPEKTPSGPKTGKLLPAPGPAKPD